jgi:hypothetical protein
MKGVVKLQTKLEITISENKRIKLNGKSSRKTITVRNSSRFI